MAHPPKVIGYSIVTWHGEGTSHYHLCQVVSDGENEDFDIIHTYHSIEAAKKALNSLELEVKAEGN